MSFPTAPTQRKDKEQTKEKKRIGHDDRINLQAAIAKGLTLAQAAKLLGKSRSTIYREILNNAIVKDCRHSCSHCRKSCPQAKRPPFRHGRCPLFEARECKRWRSWPYCCNGCPESRFCADRKRFYDCVDANSLSLRKRHEPRGLQGHIRRRRRQRHGRQDSAPLQGVPDRRPILQNERKGGPVQVRVAKSGEN